MTRERTIIIGGGLAGAAAAILTARAGRSVTLIERESQAHDKVCGEFISWEAAHYLRDLGIDLRALGAQTVHSLRLAVGARVLESPLTFEAWSLSRRMLDEALLVKAAQAGAEVMRGRTATGVQRGREEWIVDTPGGPLHAGTLFLATGKHDMRGWRRGTEREHNKIGFKMHFRLTPEQHRHLQDHVEVILYDGGGYAGLEAIEDGKANLCLTVDKHRYARCGKSWEGLLGWLNIQSPHLASRLQGAAPLWPRPLAIYGIPYGYLYKPEAHDSDLFRLGDQMAVIPSFAGDGMSIALHSAFLASGCCLEGGGAPAYHRLARDAFDRPLCCAGILSALMSTANGRHAAFWLFKNFPKLIPPLIQSVRLAKRDILPGRRATT